MDASDDNIPRRVTLCLLVDEHTADSFPTALRYLQIGLIDEPFDTVLVASEDPRALALWTAPSTLLTYRRPQWPFLRWSLRRSVDDIVGRLNEIRRDSTVVVHCLSSAIAPLAAGIAAAMDSELVLTVSSAAEVNNPDVRTVLDRVAVFLAPTPLIERAVTESSFPRATVELVPVGVPAKSSPAAFSNQLRSPSLVVAGELTPDADIETLLHAVKRVLPHHPTLAVFVLGKGPSEQSLRHLANALGIGLHVTFTGRLEHWRTAMEAADIFCLPGVCSAFREEPLHALATGLAIVASEDSPYEELANEETALLFPSGDIEQLAEQLRALLDNPERSRMFAATAQAQARSCHSASRMIADHVRVYSRVATRHHIIPIAADR